LLLLLLILDKVKGNNNETNLQPQNIVKRRTVYYFCGMIHMKLYDHSKSPYI